MIYRKAERLQEQRAGPLRGKQSGGQQHHAPLSHPVPVSQGCQLRRPRPLPLLLPTRLPPPRPPCPAERRCPLALAAQVGVRKGKGRRLRGGVKCELEHTQALHSPAKRHTPLHHPVPAGGVRCRSPAWRWAHLGGTQGAAHFGPLGLLQPRRAAWGPCRGGAGMGAQQQQGSEHGQQGGQGAPTLPMPGAQGPAAAAMPPMPSRLVAVAARLLLISRCHGQHSTQNRLEAPPKPKPASAARAHRRRSSRSRGGAAAGPRMESH